MTYRGYVRRGTVVLEEAAALPEGTAVSVRALKSTAATRAAKPKRAAASLYQRLKPIIGRAKSLPPDVAANHDHYLYGVPKRGGKRRKAS